MRQFLFTSLVCLPWLVAEAAPADPGKPPAPLSLIVELTDGSRLVGTAEIDTLPFIAKYGRMALVMKEMASVTLGEDRETAKVAMRNGDNLQGVLDIGDLKLRTLLGELSVPIRHVVRITAGDGWLPPDVFGPPGKLFEVPLGAKDRYGNPIRRGRDPKTGLPYEIRHKETGMHLIFAPAGEFMMGSPEDEEGRINERGRELLHRVQISRPLYIGKYEVTQSQWTSLVDRNPSHFKGDRNPVEMLNWHECQEFVKKLNASLPIPPGSEPRRRLGEGRGEGRSRFSLLTEAQWEYACRAGTRTAFFWGDDKGRVIEFAWSEKDAENRVHPVGLKKPNAWGIYDMSGNTNEWCADWHGPYSSEMQIDPTGSPNVGWGRASRGSSRNAALWGLRSANRHRNGPGDRAPDQGFRVALNMTGGKLRR